MVQHNNANLANKLQWRVATGNEIFTYQAQSAIFCHQTVLLTANGTLAEKGRTLSRPSQAACVLVKLGTIHCYCVPPMSMFGGVSEAIVHASAAMLGYSLLLQSACMPQLLPVEALLIWARCRQVPRLTFASQHSWHHPCRAQQNQHSGGGS